jgi:hypothetical protein
MKKITLGCSVLVAAAMFVVGCNKKTNTAPVADTEFQSSKDATYANSIVTDLEIICSYLGENLLTSAYLTPAPGTAGGSTITTSRDTVNKILTINFTNTVTCKDGKKRNGQIVLNYSASTSSLGAKFYRDAGFVANVTLNNYSVDGWLIDEVAPFKITNNVAFGFNPATTPLNWILDGNFTIDNPNDASMSMTWKGKLNKILTNTSEVALNKLTPIAWVTYSAGVALSGAKVEYKGVEGTVPNVTGLTSVTKGYSLTIKDDAPLKRDFTCAPDKVIGVTSTTTTPITVLPIYSEWHPFVSGKVSFTTNSLPDPRLIDFGNEGIAPCDNAGTVTIKGISYPIDFKK